MMAAPIWSPQHAANRRRYSSDLRDLAQQVWTFGGLFPQGPPDPANSDALAAARDFVASGADVGIRATQLLDEQLALATEAGRTPLVLFSGGVDSSLIASRLQALGHDDIRLLHFSFREDDPETIAARQIADLLELDLQIVQRDDRAELACLDSPGAVYPIPFGDQSAPATYQLCQAVADHADPADVVVIDGTGADGAFGLAAYARALSAAVTRVPAFGLRAGSFLYKTLLARRPGRLEYQGRVARRLAHLAPPTAYVAQNALFGLLYDAPALPRVDADWAAQLGVLNSTDLVEQVVLTDLTLTCAAVFAQKTLGPLTHAGFDVSYPFLSSDLAALGAAHSVIDHGSEPKAWMKTLLAERIGDDLVHRQKSGFIDPERAMFDDPVLRAALGDALAPDGVAVDLIRTKAVRRLLESGTALSRIPVGHQNALWSLAFVDRWVRTGAGHAAIEMA